MEITGLLFKQMLVLFAMMAAGYLAFRAGVFGRTGQKEISALIVRVLNPFLMISSVLSHTEGVDGPVLLQNLAMVGMYYAFLIAASFLYVRLRRFSARERCLQQLMLVLSNLGFLGIPVVRAVYGPQYVIYLVFYIMLFNVLAYTYGIYLASGSAAEKKPANAGRAETSAPALANAGNGKGSGSASANAGASETSASVSANAGASEASASASANAGRAAASASASANAGSRGASSSRFPLRRIVNIGTISSMIAIVLFILRPPVAEPVQEFCSYMGNACVPLSMILIGGSLAQLPLREIFRNPENYIFTAVKMLILPAIGILLARFLPFSPEAKSVLFLVLSMPVASLAGMLAEEYGGCGNEVNKVTAMTTIASVLTIPLLSLLYA